VRSDLIPVAAGATLNEALGGGEDYELLATLPEPAVEEARALLDEGFGVPLSSVGVITAQPGVEASGPGGPASVLAPAGWDHFQGPAQR
jgi:thiamine monophosphate kinase